MAEMSPENLQKLIKSKARAQPVAAAAGMGGLSAGDKMELMSGFEKILNTVLSGSEKMGGKAGLLDRVKDYLSDFSEEIQEDMKKLFGMSQKDKSDDKDKDPVEIDPEQFRKLSKQNLIAIYNSKEMKSLQADRASKLKKFLMKDVVGFIVNSKIVRGLVNGLRNISGELGVFVEKVGSFIVGTAKVLTKIVKATSAILIRMTFMLFSVIATIVSFAASIIMFVVTTVIPLLFTIIGFILFTILPAIVSGVIAFIAFMTPIAISVAIIALKVLLVVAVIFLIIFIIWKVWDWLSKTFPKQIEAIKNFFISVWEAAKELWDGFIKIAAESWQWLKETASKAWDAATEAWGWLYENIGQIFDWVKNIFVDTWNWLESVPYVGEVFKWIRETLFDLMSNVHTLFFGDGPFLERLVNFFLDTELFQDLAAVGNWILDTLQSAWAEVYGWIKGISEWVFGAVDAVKDTVTNAAKETWQAVTDVGQKTWEGIKSVGSALNPLNWFAAGGIVDQPTLAMIGEKVGVSEAVIPLDGNGMSFLAKAISESNAFAGGSYFNNLATTEIQTLKNTYKLQDILGQLYQFVMDKEVNFSGITTPADSLDPMNWLASGGIIKKKDIVGVGEEGPEMVVPLNNSGVEFVRNILKDELYSGESGSDKIGELDAKMNALIKMMKTGRSSEGTPINSSTSRDTANYVDMVAKGIIG